MVKSSSIISLIAALLLFQQYSVAHAQTGKAIRQTYTVSKIGWMNLRRIDSSPQIGGKEHWYVCGQRKVIYFPEIRDPRVKEDGIETLGQQPEIGKEFFAYTSSVLPVERFVTDAIKRERFMVSATAACAASATTVAPPSMNLEKNHVEGFFYYLSPSDLTVSGDKRGFWLYQHAARKVMRRLTHRSDGTPYTGWLADPFEVWLVRYARHTAWRVEINCAAGQVQYLYGSVQDESTGKVVAENINRDPEFIVPDTIAAYWRDVVCLIK